MTTLKTLSSFIEETQLRLELTRTDRNPFMENSERMNHWTATIHSNLDLFTVIFSQGPGIKHDPSLEDILSCLASDVAGLLNSTGFENWCQEYGYDSDSRKALHIYEAIERQAQDLKDLFTDEQWDALLWNTERL